MGISIGPSGKLYIADYANSRVRVVDTSQVIDTLAGTGTQGYNGDGIAATAAQLNRASGVCADVNGNVWIADQWNCRIRGICRGTFPAGRAMGTLDIHQME